jgi:hypothetical protein
MMKAKLFACAKLAITNDVQQLAAFETEFS